MKRTLGVFVALLAIITVVGPAVAADQSVGQKLDDTKITTAVKTKLAADKLKTLVNVGVETNGGIVRLYGKVPTAEDKFEAERVARRAKGVKDVNNELHVEASNTSPAASSK
jgi:hyperosmotically inducible periplasmic protein